MTRIAIVIACLQLGACFQSHATGQRELAGTECYSCHTTDYAGTTAPVHRDAPQTFSTTCANCHRTVSWKPALEGLHSETFIITSGPHAEIACLGCHDLTGVLPSKLGTNTNCIQCHPDDAHQKASHAEVEEEEDEPYRYQGTVPSFCLSCHPAGTAEAHPDKLFARTKDHAVPCADCHDRTTGRDTKGANVTCVDARCHHTLRESDDMSDHEDSDYTRARGNGSNRAFCHQCHS